MGVVWGDMRGIWGVWGVFRGFLPPKVGGKYGEMWRDMGSHGGDIGGMGGSFRVPEVWGGVMGGWGAFRGLLPPKLGWE